MRALVVYESMYGNTHVVANCIAEGLRDKACDVTVVPASRATAEMAVGTDLLVVGGPTHVHASNGIARRLRQRGYHLVVPAESFLVSKQNTLLDSEAQRAQSWGAALAFAAGPVPHVPSG